MRRSKATGMRTGYWGPLSGVNATIGGALSQNSAFFGSALHGTVADSVLGVTVVLANGEIVTTGSGARNGAAPFTRHGGPDLTGIFLGDNGAFGVKVAATLRLLPRPQHTATLPLFRLREHGQRWRRRRSRWRALAWSPRDSASIAPRSSIRPASTG